MYYSHICVIKIYDLWALFKAKRDIGYFDSLKTDSRKAINIAAFETKHSNLTSSFSSIQFKQPSLLGLVEFGCLASILLFPAPPKGLVFRAVPDGFLVLFTVPLLLLWGGSELPGSGKIETLAHPASTTGLS